MRWNELAVIGCVEELFVRNYRGFAVFSFLVPKHQGHTQFKSVSPKHTHTHRQSGVWAEGKTLNSSFLKQTLSFHSFFSSELSISSGVWQTSGGERSLKAGKVDLSVIRRCSHFGTCQSLHCTISENHPSALCHGRPQVHYSSLRSILRQY